MNEITRLAFELDYNEVSVQNVSHYTTGNTPLIYVYVIMIRIMYKIIYIYIYIYIYKFFFQYLLSSMNIYAIIFLYIYSYLLTLTRNYCPVSFPHLSWWKQYTVKVKANFLGKKRKKKELKK